MEQRLRLGLRDGAQQVGQRSIGVADGNEGHDVDRPRRDVARFVGCGGPRRPRQANGGLDPHAGILGGRHRCHLGGGQHPDPGAAEAEGIAHLVDVRPDVGGVAAGPAR